MLWPSGVVVDQTFTPRGVDVHARLLVDHRCINIFICMLNFHGWFQPWNYLNTEIFQSTVFGPLSIHDSILAWNDEVILATWLNHGPRMKSRSSHHSVLVFKMSLFTFLSVCRPQIQWKCEARTWVQCPQQPFFPHCKACWHCAHVFKGHVIR